MRNPDAALAFRVFYDGRFDSIGFHQVLRFLFCGDLQNRLRILRLR